MTAQMLQEIRNKSTRLMAIADQIAKVLNDAGVAQRQGSYLDSRCEEIKTLCLDIGRMVGANT